MQQFIKFITTNMKDKNIAYMLSMISLFVCVYYYCSLDLIWHFLAPFKLHLLSIISWEDVQFSFAPYLVKPMLVFLITYGGVTLFLVSTPLETEKNKLRESIKKIINEIIGKYAYISIIYSLLIACIIGLLYTIKYDSTIGIIILTMTGACLAYSKYGKADIVFAIFIFFIMIIYCDHTKKEVSEIYNSDIKVEFTNGETIETDAKHKLIFWGTKFIIIQNDSINAKLYPTERIKEIEWINKKKLD